MPLDAARPPERPRHIGTILGNHAGHPAPKRQVTRHQQDHTQRVSCY